MEVGGGAPYDIACYCVDACNRYAGSPPSRVHALTSTSERYGTVARVFGLVEYGNGVVGMIESSMRGDFNHELRLNGTRGHARLPVAWRIDHPTEVVASRSVGWGLTEDGGSPSPSSTPTGSSWRASRQPPGAGRRRSRGSRSRSSRRSPSTRSSRARRRASRSSPSVPEGLAP